MLIETILTAENRSVDLLVPVPDPAEPRRPDASRALVRRLVQVRRLRNRLLDPDLFQDPAWDVLLELYDSHHNGRQATVTGICAAADLPVTTGLRALQRLEGRGYVTRAADPADRRRTLLLLTPFALEQMNRLLEEWSGQKA